MSIENRLTSLQVKLEELLELTKKGKASGPEDPDPQRKPFPSAIVEIRTLELWKSVVAECLGSLCYVFFVCGVSIPWTGHFPPFLSIAFATALVYGALTYRVFPGAHLNPAFSVALTAVQKISTIRCLLYVTAQCGGAIAGAAILFGLTVPGYQGQLGSTAIASHVEPIQAFGLELILTFVLTLTYVSDPKNCVPTSCVLLAASLVALPCTGAGLNPMRSLGPAFVMNKWPRHWVFWLGPILGALLAAYFHKYVLKRRSGKKGKEGRTQPSDGDSLDIPPTELPVTTPDRLLSERLEPIYGGTRSLYMKPSPVLPRANLNRSQSVYASKRFEYPAKFLDSASTSKKLTSPRPETNYEPLYDRKPGLVLSGPPSYESSYYKTYEKPHSSHGHAHNNHHHHHREKSDSSHHHCPRGRDRELEPHSHTSRILAQYETAKGFVDVDPKAALRESKTSYYETSEILRKHGLVDPAEKKLIDTSSGSESGITTTSNSHQESHRGSGDPPPPPRFRIPIPPTNQEPTYGGHRYPSTRNEVQGNDLSRGNSINKHHGGGVEHSHGGLTVARKPYEMLEGQKLMEFSPKSLTSPHHVSSLSQQQQANHYSPRLLMEKDANYTRMLDPILSPKSLPSGNNSNKHSQHHHHQTGQGHIAPDDHLTYSYH